MGIKIIMTICMLPLLPIMYGIFHFIAKEKNGTLYGVTLWEGARESQQVQKIQKSYKRNLNLWTLLCFLLFLATLLPDYDSLLVSGQILWIYFTIVALFIPFAQANKQMMQQKREYQSHLPVSEPFHHKVYVDVTAATAKKPKFFRKSLYVGCVLGAMPAVAEPFLYSVWHNPQMSDFWDCEIVLLIMATAVFLFPFFLSVMEKQRTNVISPDSQANLQFARVRQYQWGKFCMVLAWGTGGLNWGMLLAFHLPSEWFLWITIGTGLLFTLSSLGILYRCSRRIEKARKKYQNSSIPYASDGSGLQGNRFCAPQDQDEHWVWGMFYYNEDDSRSMVEKRLGIGVTGNFAKPRVRYGTFISIFVLSLSMLGVCAWSVAEEFTPISLSYENEAIIAHHWKEVYRIERAELKSVALIQEKPDIKRRKGTSMQSVEKGDYYDRTNKKDIKVCLDPRKEPFIVLETKDGIWYLLGSSDAEETMEIYKELDEPAVTPKDFI